MKKETILTAIVFFGVGFLAGYIYDAQKNSDGQQAAVSTASSGDSTPSAAAAPNENAAVRPQGLPEGHPPVDTALLVKFFEGQAAQNPQDPGPRLKVANLLYDQRQFEQAAEWYQKALELDPRDVNARTDLGNCYYNLGRPQEALREYRRSLAIDPKHEPTLYNLIMVNLEGTHDLKAARAAWARLQSQNPDYPGLERLKQSLDAARAAPASP